MIKFPHAKYNFKLFLENNNNNNTNNNQNDNGM